MREKRAKRDRPKEEISMDSWVYENWLIEPCSIDSKPGFKCKNAVQHFFIPCDLLIYIMGEWQKASASEEEK